MESQKMKEVTVVLTAETPASDLAYPNRRLRLTKENPSTQVGRTSNRYEEYKAKLENVYVESPVMSRKHAEIYADFDSARVFVKDIGSLHGTHLRNEKLVPKVPRALGQGDVIRFGTMVRNPPTGVINPISFRVRIDFTKEAADDPVQAASNKFEVPEDSSDGGDSDTDSDVDFAYRVMKACGVGTSKKETVVDLTLDDPAEEDIGTSQTKGPGPNTDHVSICSSDDDEDADMGADDEVNEADNEVIDMGTGHGQSAEVGKEKRDGPESIRLSEPCESDSSEAEKCSSVDEMSDSEGMPSDNEDDDAFYDEEDEEEEEEEDVHDDDDVVHDAGNMMPRLPQISSLLSSGSKMDLSAGALPPIRWQQGPVGPTSPLHQQAQGIQHHNRDPGGNWALDHGRSEYFMAREANKRVLSVMNGDRQSHTFISGPFPVEGGWAESGHRFLSSPPADTFNKAKEAVPDFTHIDDTSAFTYHVSKQAAKAKANPDDAKVADKEDTAALPITPASEKCETPEVLAAPRPEADVLNKTKRKFDDMEVDAAPVTPVKKSQGAGNVGGQADELTGMPTPAATATEPPTPDDHRGKRLKAVANVVGLATLGGIAGGLALFTSLVATGPTFA